MEKILLKRITEFVNRNLESKDKYKKVGYADGYFAAMGDIKNLIDFGVEMLGISKD